MRLLRALLLWIGIGILTVLFGLPAILAAFVPPRGDWFLSFARGWARSILALAGISVKTRNLDRVPPGRSFVIVSNHESFCDILVLLARLPIQMRFLAKRSIFRVPVLGWSIGAAGFVPVDRGDRRRSAATLEAALRRLRGGRSILVFPEETRSPTVDLLPFKNGAAVLALRSGLALLPVGLAGTRATLPRGVFVMSAGRVALVAGEPIEVSGMAQGARRELTQRARAAIEALRAEAAALFG